MAGSAWNRAGPPGRSRIPGEPHRRDTWPRRREPAGLEQFSEFRHTWKGTPYDSILRSAHLNSLASLGQKVLRSFVKCSTSPYACRKVSRPN
ncbi:hypothetical protein D3875_14710 [Deinococcus cavernae]|uniref:Uncharacterized protein n=1 Tax=Deinococcus cavernae TaxID=2320857 RepID=A0A418V912_9DEIO|nr:hypothetical protein D3875_14710 [Deinococcus cavernae]